MSLQVAAQPVMLFSSPGTQNGTASFSNRVRTAGVSLMGYKVGFGDADHHVKDLQVSASLTGTNDTSVNYSVTFLLQDDSENKGSAEVNVVVFADVEAS